MSGGNIVLFNCSSVKLMAKVSFDRVESGTEDWKKVLVL